MLLDASAFFWAIKEGLDLREHFVLDLTFYELGNIVWKRKLGAELLELLEFCRVIYIWHEDLPEILKIARDEGLTFYDASYVHFATKYGLELVTADKKLAKVARKYVKTKLVEAL